MGRDAPNVAGHYNKKRAGQRQQQQHHTQTHSS